MSIIIIRRRVVRIIRWIDVVEILQGCIKGMGVMVFIFSHSIYEVDNLSRHGLFNESSTLYYATITQGKKCIVILKISARSKVDITDFAGEH